MAYIIVIVVSLVMIATTVCTTFKVGEKENISKYDYKED